MSVFIAPSRAGEPPIFVQVDEPTSGLLELEVPGGGYDAAPIKVTSRHARRIAIALLNAADAADFGQDHDEDPDL